MTPTTYRRPRAQGASSRDVGVRRLPGHGRDVPHRRSARGSSRPRGIAPRRSACSTSPPAPATRRSPPPRPAPRSSRATSRPSCSRPAARARGRRRASSSTGWRPTPSTCPFEDESFDVVMSSIGVMFAPHHQQAADELVRVCRPGGTIGAAELDARGHARRAVPHDAPVHAGAAARARSPRRCGAARTTCASSSATASRSRTLERETLEITAFARGPRLRRALQGALRPDDRGAQERREGGPRGGVRRRAGPLLRRVGPRRARARRASRRST